jgi:hypothetical protein
MLKNKVAFYTTLSKQTNENKSKKAQFRFLYVIISIKVNTVFK